MIYRFEICKEYLLFFFKKKTKVAILAAREQRSKASTYLKAVERVLDLLIVGDLSCKKLEKEKAKVSNLETKEKDKKKKEEEAIVRAQLKRKWKEEVNSIKLEK